ncbi:MAG: 4,5-dihydroxyphthalate decarboxylase [Candidatus Binataceae bacterium]
MNKIQLTIAISDYEHVRDLTFGLVQPEGIDLVRLNMPLEEIFWRFTRFREWDISEMSFANYTALISRGDDSMTAIPVFPSRAFRLSAVYLRRESGIAAPQELIGKRIGIPEWIETAGVYARGYLAHHCGVSLDRIEWYQGGLTHIGREEKMAFDPPPGVQIRRAERPLEEMLRAGEIEAIMTALEPSVFARGEEWVTRFPNFQAAEEEYCLKTGIFPIMHLVVIRTEVLRSYPWVAMNMFTAFEEAKRRGLKRLFEVTASRIPVAWSFLAGEKTRKFFTGEYWPYGIEPNRTTLEAFLQYAYEQGVAAKRLKPEDLFAKETLSLFKI